MGETAIDRLLAFPPYGVPDDEKAPLFAAAMAESFAHHAAGSPEFGRFVAAAGWRRGEHRAVAEWPWLPAPIFKVRRLLSVPESSIVARLASSSTSGVPSEVAIDAITQQRQIRALAAVVGDRIGAERRPYVMLDLDPRRAPPGPITARAAAVRGFLKFAREVRYVVEETNGSLALDDAALARAVAEIAERGEPAVVLGFTFVLHRVVVAPLLARGETRRLPPGSKVVHLGGWKRLEDERVTREQLVAESALAFAIPPEDVIDVYGFTEQMGLNYPDCEAGAKHVPVFAEVVVREPNGLTPARDGEEGFLQFLTPVPNSYPGVSLLLDDVGAIVGRGRCSCGRFGTRFRVVGRTRRAEPRGCSDVVATRFTAERASIVESAVRG